MSNDLIVNKENSILKITFNRPERRNALSHDMLNSLYEELIKVENDSSIRALVLTGAGNAFCAGGDLKDMAERNNENETTQEKTNNLRHMMETSRILHEMPTPTIAILPGAAAGAGLSLALACDMRIASENAKITTAFAKAGFPGDFGGTFFLTQMVGTAKARELYYLSSVLTANEAKELGIINRVASDENLENVANEVIEQIATGPSTALRYMKHNMNLAEKGNLNASLDSEALYQSLCRDTEDHRNAAKAFVAKKKPVFTGR